MSDRKKRTTDYEVGYRKPPKESQFKKGQSGNPKGRPKGAKGVRASLRRELESKIKIREENREQHVSKYEAIAKRLIAAALTGDMKAMLRILEIDAELFTDGADKGSASYEVQSLEQIDLEILRDYFASTSETKQGVEDEEDEDDDR